MSVTKEKALQSMDGQLDSHEVFRWPLSAEDTLAIKDAACDIWNWGLGPITLNLRVGDPVISGTLLGTRRCQMKKYIVRLSDQERGVCGISSSGSRGRRRK